MCVKLSVYVSVAACKVNVNYLFQKMAYTDQDQIIVVSLEEVI